MFKYKYALIGCLLFPVILRLNLQGTGFEADLGRFIPPLVVGGIAGFLIGIMKDRWKKLNGELEFLVEARTKDLQKALDEVKTLQGILPICSVCKCVRNDDGFYERIDTYIQNHSEAIFSHGICPKCSDELYGDQAWYKKKSDKNVKIASIPKANLDAHTPPRHEKDFR